MIFVLLHVKYRTFNPLAWSMALILTTLIRWRFEASLYKGTEFAYWTANVLWGVKNTRIFEGFGVLRVLRREDS